MKKSVKKLFIGIICFSLFFSNISIPVNAGSAGTAINIAKMLDALGKTVVTTGVGKAVENLVDKWFSGEKKYYDSTSEKTSMDYYAQNSAVNKATGNISNSGANNENCYNTFSSTVTDNRTFSLIKDSYNTTTNNYSTLLYSPITNNYTELSSTSNIYHNEQYQTYFIENNEYNYYVTNNYTYVSYYIINNETNEESYYEIYYEMPDGRNSYDLEKEDIWGEYFVYDVVGYESVQEDDGKTLALYHFDGDGKDSSYWKNNDASLSSGVFTDGKFGQGIIVSQNTQVEIYLKNELNLNDYTVELTLLNPGSPIDSFIFMMENTVEIRNYQMLKSGIQSFVFQSGDYNAVFPITSDTRIVRKSSYETPESMWDKHKNSGFAMGALKSDTFYYLNGGKNYFSGFTSLNVNDATSLYGDNYGVRGYGEFSITQDSTNYYNYYVSSIENKKPTSVSSESGIYIFDDRIVIKNTSSQSFILDELRISNCKLYDTETISVPTQAFDTNQVLAVPENPSENMIAVQAKYEVTDFRVGGVRPTYPTKGYVYVYLEDDVVKDVQQYEGDAWYSVHGAIYQDGEWWDLSGCNLSDLTFEEVEDSGGSDSSDSGTDSGDDSGGSSGSVSGNGSDGSGIGDLIGGIGKIFDTILSLIGKLMGVVADFAQSILDLFSGFTAFTDGFSDFLSGAFGFVPADIWNVIKVGLSLMVLLAVIKFLRK